MFVLDTNVVSELRKLPAGKASREVARWAQAVDAGDLYVSVITMMELETGVLRMERRDARQGALLRDWMDRWVLPEFAGRILAVDTAVAKCCARLHVPDPRSYRDAFIASCAMVHGMTLVTRNTPDFESMGVPQLNPWKAMP